MKEKEKKRKSLAENENFREFIEKKVLQYLTNPELLDPPTRLLIEECDLGCLVFFIELSKVVPYTISAVIFFFITEIVLGHIEGVRVEDHILTTVVMQGISLFSTWIGLDEVKGSAQRNAPRGLAMEKNLLSTNFEGYLKSVGLAEISGYSKKEFLGEVNKTLSHIRTEMMKNAQSE
jgi:hypothetical protein